MKQKRKEREWVNHPNHYGGESNPYEFIKVAEAWGWDQDSYLFTAGRYMVRAGKKFPEKEIEDLNKAIWYLNRKIEIIKKEKKGD